MIDRMGFEASRLALRVEAPVRTVVQIGEIAVPLRSGVPRRLPPHPGRVVGRTRELAAVVRAVEGSVRTVVVTGGPGSGRSATAAAAAHRLAPLFPDAVLSDGLADRATSAADLARWVLGELGLPATPDPVAACRAVLAERRLLLLLDDVADDAAATLLPSGSASFLLLTARRGLGLPRVRLGELDAHSAAELLGTTDPDLLAACAGVPLALRITALRLADEPRPAVAAALAPAHRTLGELRVGDRGMREAVERAVAALAPEPRAVLRGLGAFPLVDVTVETTAAMAGLPRSVVAAGLAVLADAHLVRRRAPHRYTVPPLVRRFAEEDVRDRGGPRELAAAGDRVARYYGRALERANDRWWGSEWPNLVPLARHLDGRDRAGLDHLADTVADRRRARAPWGPWSEIQRAALRRAETEGPPERRAVLQVRLGAALRATGDPEAALAVLAGAEERFAAAGDPVSAADAARTAADAERDRGAPVAAEGGYRRALAALAGRGGADALRATAWALLGLAVIARTGGDHRRAARCLRSARERFRALDDDAGRRACDYQESSSSVVGSAAPSCPSRARTSSSSAPVSKPLSKPVGSGCSELTVPPSRVVRPHDPRPGAR